MDARVIKLCAGRNVPERARRLTRFDGPGDEAIIAHLVAFARQRPQLEAADGALLAAVLLDESRRWLRGRLIEALKDHNLEAIAAQAAAAAGLADAAQRVAYCLVVLYQKQDPPRGETQLQYDLTLGSSNFGGQLRFWARSIARNMHADGQKIARAQAPGAQGLEWLTANLRARSQPWQEDVADRVAVKLWELLALRTPRPAEMTLEYAREHNPPRAQYVYHREFDAWLGMTWKRARPRRTIPLDQDSGARAQQRPDEDLEARDERRRREAREELEAELDLREVEIYCAVEEAIRSRKLIPKERADLARVASESAGALRFPGRAATRVTLDPALKRRARELWLGLDKERAVPARADLGSALARRAVELWHDLDEERAELPRMLRHIDVTMRGPKEIRRLVAALSLRRQGLEPPLRDYLATSCPRLLADLPVVPDDDRVIAAEVRKRIPRAKTDASGVGSLRDYARDDLAREHPAWARAFGRYGYARGAAASGR
jgi:hypothetical protein